MNDIEAQRVLQHIEEGRATVIDLLRDLVAFPSVTGDEADIQRFIAGRLGAMGLEVDVFEPDHDLLRRHPAYVPTDLSYAGRPNVVGILRGTGGGRSLLFNGHVDVIPSGSPEGWAHSPWGAEIDGGRLHGRGASDMKSGLAAMTTAVQTIVSLGIRLKGDLILEYTVDEEATGNGTLACVLRGYRADAGICCETSSMHVQPACIGRIWFEIDVRGKPAGIQRRWEGVNAIEKGYGVVQAVAELERIRIESVSHPLYPDRLGSMPCMVGSFQAGSFPSAFPDSCLLKGSIATLPGEDTGEVMAQFERHIAAHAAADPWLAEHLPQVRFTGYRGDPAEIPADHPIVATVSRNFRGVLGRDPEITGRQGAADIRYLIRYGGTPSVIFGPGPTEQMHATDEWVRTDDVVAATKVLALSILEWCGVE